MAKKFLRKLMVVMMDLIILILGDMGANDLTPTSFHFSSHPILTRLPSKLDS